MNEKKKSKVNVNVTKEKTIGGENDRI